MVSPFCGAVKLAISTFSAVSASVVVSVAEALVVSVVLSELLTPALPLHDAKAENTSVVQKTPARIFLNMISLLENVKLYDSMFKTEQKTILQLIYYTPQKPICKEFS
jgi:hypothetical protein